MPSTPTPLRYTLECQALPWQVLYVEQRTSLARPPSMVLDVTTDRHLTELAEVERSTASLLIEGPDLSRVVRGWVRYVEHIGVVDSRARLRLYLVPTTMAEDAPARRVEVSAKAPAMLANSPAEGPVGPEWAVEPALVPTPRFVEPPSLEEQEVTAEYTPEELRAMRGEDDTEGDAHRRPVKRPRTPRQRELTEVAPRNDAQGLVPKRRRSAEDDTAVHGTRLVTYAELHASLGGGRGDDERKRTSATTDQWRSTPVRTGETQLMPREDLERFEAGVPPRDGTPARTDTKRQSQPTPRDDQPERRRRKKRRADDETPPMTWEEIEAMHRDRGKPKP